MATKLSKAEKLAQAQEREREELRAFINGHYLITLFKRIAEVNNAHVNALGDGAAHIVLTPVATDFISGVILCASDTMPDIFYSLQNGLDTVASVFDRMPLFDRMPPIGSISQKEIESSNCGIIEIGITEVEGWEQRAKSTKENFEDAMWQLQMIMDGLESYQKFRQEEQKTLLKVHQAREKLNSVMTEEELRLLGIEM
jgi:hypothetical protein